MTTRSRLQDIKRGQKESLLFKEISALFMKAAIDDPNLAGLAINRVSLSDDKSMCTVYFYTAKGKEDFDQKLGFLKLYKPSLRKSIAKTIKGRYVPEIKFAFDEQFEKQQKVEELFEKLKREGQL